MLAAFDPTKPVAQLHTKYVPMNARAHTVTSQIKVDAEAETWDGKTQFATVDDAVKAVQLRHDGGTYAVVSATGAAKAGALELHDAWGEGRDGDMIDMEWLGVDSFASPIMTDEHGLRQGVSVERKAPDLVALVNEDFLVTFASDELGADYGALLTKKAGGDGLLTLLPHPAPAKS